MLQTLVILLAAAAVAVPLSRRAGFGSVLGYLVAGVAIGPSGLRLVTDVEQIAAGRRARRGDAAVPDRAGAAPGAALGDAQGGVRPRHRAGRADRAAARRRWRTRPGSAGPARRCSGVGLALSSTAIVLPMLGERELLASRAGRDAFAVLLFQDLAFIPLVALVPLLGGDAVPDRRCRGWTSARGVGRDRRHPGRRPLPAAAARSALIGGARRRRCSPPWRC